MTLHQWLQLLLPMLLAILIVPVMNYFVGRVGTRTNRREDWYQQVDKDRQTFQELARDVQRLTRLLDDVAKRTDIIERQQQRTEYDRNLHQEDRQRLASCEKKVGECDYKVGLIFRRIEDNIADLFIQRREH